MKRTVDEVFVTEGLPQETYVDPPNYGLIYLDIKNPRKPVIIEGQSGTGKTTTVKKIIERISGSSHATYLTARKPGDAQAIYRLVDSPNSGIYVIDDFHRLPEEIQMKLADIAKISAEQDEFDRFPKLVLIGINQVGSGLINFASDVAKRLGIHKIAPATLDKATKLIQSGCETLNIEFSSIDEIYRESRGDYWLTQQLCQTACALSNVFETSDAKNIVPVDIQVLRAVIIDKLSSAYAPAIKEFCRGRRFRPTNDPYFKLLKAVSEQDATTVDLSEIANNNPDIRQSINNIKDHRLSVLLESKPKAAKYLYYNSDTKQLSVEDPALFYYVRHLDWSKMRVECGFSNSAGPEKEFDVAISFVGENRSLAEYIARQLKALDVSVFYDREYEVNYLGTAWSAQFERIFIADSRFVVCLLDGNHKAKIWPTFERDCFSRRVADQEVIPVYLDDSVFPGIPSDIVGVKFVFDESKAGWQTEADEKIVYRLIDRIG